MPGIKTDICGKSFVIRVQINVKKDGIYYSGLAQNNSSQKQ